MRKALILATALTVSTPFVSMQASAQECVIGTIEWFGMTWVPRGYLPANGRLLSISQFSALYSLFGTAYGGDGRTTFALPDLRGRASLGQGSGPGLTPRSIGEKLGSETNTLSQNQMPLHIHGIASGSGNQVVTDVTIDVAKGEVRSGSGASVVTDVISDVTEGSATGASKTESAGGSQPVNNMQPYLVLTPGVCANGIYPSRN